MVLRQVKDLCARFGIDRAVFAELGFALAQEVVFVATREVMEFDAVRPMRRGIRLCRLFPHSTKPTTWAMQVLGRHATRNVVDVSEQQAATLIGGTGLELECEADDGFVLIRCRGFVVGVGLYKRPLLKSQIPRHRPVDSVSGKTGED